jgi:TolB-like protein
MTSVHNLLISDTFLNEIVSPERIREELARILASTDFKASPRRREMLSYLIEEMLAGRGHELKGYTIGVSVFRRGDQFDAQSDPVVRLEARRLRRDLASYYVAAGRRNPLRITIPTGSYVPEIRHREPEGSTLEDAAMAGTTNEAEGASREGGAATGVGTRNWWRPVIGALLVAIVIVGGLIYASWYRSDQGELALQRPALLVLPFKTHGDGPDAPILAMGISERLIANLSRFPDIRLYAPTVDSVEAPMADPAKTGAEHGTSYLLTGSVNEVTPDIRIGAQLVEMTSGRVIWAEQFDRKLDASSLLVLESDIATAIATALGQPYGVIKTELTDRLSGKFAPSISSYECVLRAYTYRRTFATELHAPVLACLEAAVKRDPEFADAWAMLGWLQMDAGRFNLVPAGEVDHSYARALAAASHAVTLDRRSILALKALASINHYIGNYEESEQIQREALALNPNDPDTLAQLGWRLAVRGRFGEGIPYLQQAIQQSVNPPGWYYHLIAIDHYMNAAFPQMLEAAKRSAADGSSISWSLVAIAQGALGNEAAAREALSKMAEISPSFARNPAAGYRRHQATDEIVDALMVGLRKAGWTEVQSQ